jgi:hypothetical protein
MHTGWMAYIYRSASVFEGHMYVVYLLQVCAFVHFWQMEGHLLFSTLVHLCICRYLCMEGQLCICRYLCMEGHLCISQINHICSHLCIDTYVGTMPKQAAWATNDMVPTFHGSCLAATLQSEMSWIRIPDCYTWITHDMVPFQYLPITHDWGASHWGHLWIWAWQPYTISIAFVHPNAFIQKWTTITTSASSNGYLTSTTTLHKTSVYKTCTITKFIQQVWNIAKLYQNEQFLQHQQQGIVSWHQQQHYTTYLKGTTFKKKKTLCSSYLQKESENESFWL